MPLLILNGEKSDKSSWHNNACNDLGSKFSLLWIYPGKIRKLEGTKSYCELQDFIWKKRLELWEWDSKAVRLILSQSSCADCPRCLKCFLPIAFISYKSVKRWGKTIKAFTGLKSAPWLRWLEIVYNPRVPEACLINMDRQAGPLFHSDKNAN